LDDALYHASAAIAPSCAHRLDACRHEVIGERVRLRSRE
jgi:hypothetical protein